MRLILSLLLVFNLTVTANASTNVNGGDLQRCSSDGMALTGFTRNGKCEEYNSDAGSHHVCIDLSSVSSGSSQSENFCTVTGQSDWCSSQMDCNDNSGALCPVQHWCVCQWAFASYIQKAGGCQHIQNIQCDATNINAWKAYQVAASEEGENESKFKDALNCLESRCGLTTSGMFEITKSSVENSTNLVLFGFILSVICAGAYFIQVKKGKSATEGFTASPKTPLVLG